eukprot:8870284-Pyramimonas_sp.AAC.1
MPNDIYNSRVPFSGLRECLVHESIFRPHSTRQPHVPHLRACVVSSVVAVRRATDTYTLAKRGLYATHNYTQHVEQSLRLRCVVRLSPVTSSCYAAQDARQ